MCEKSLSEILWGKLCFERHYQFRRLLLTGPQPCAVLPWRLPLCDLYSRPGELLLNQSILIYPSSLSCLFSKIVLSRLLFTLFNSVLSRKFPDIVSVLCRAEILIELWSQGTQLFSLQSASFDYSCKSYDRKEAGKRLSGSSLSAWMCDRCFWRCHKGGNILKCIAVLHCL